MIKRGAKGPKAEVNNAQNQDPLRRKENVPFHMIEIGDHHPVEEAGAQSPVTEDSDHIRATETVVQYPGIEIDSLIIEEIVPDHMTEIEVQEHAIENPRIEEIETDAIDPMTNPFPFHHLKPLWMITKTIQKKISLKLSPVKFHRRQKKRTNQFQCQLLHPHQQKQLKRLSQFVRLPCRHRKHRNQQNHKNPHHQAHPVHPAILQVHPVHRHHQVAAILQIVMMNRTKKRLPEIMVWSQQLAKKLN